MINENGKLIEAKPVILPNITIIENIAIEYDVDKNINDFNEQLTDFAKKLSELEYSEKIEKSLTKQKTAINKAIKDIQEKYKDGIEPLQKVIDEKDNAKKTIIATLQSFKTEIDNIMTIKKEAIKEKCFLAIKSFVNRSLDNLSIKERFRNIDVRSLEKYAIQTHYNENTSNITGPAQTKILNEVIMPIKQQQELYNNRLEILKTHNENNKDKIDNEIEERDIEAFLLEKDVDVFYTKLNDIFNRFIEKKNARIEKDQEEIKEQQDEIERLKQEKQKQKQELIEKIIQGIAKLKQEYNIDIDTNTDYTLLDNTTLSNEKNKIYSRIDEEITTKKQKELQKELDERKKQEDELKLPFVKEIKDLQKKYSYITNLQNLLEVNKSTEFANKNINELNINELQITIGNIKSLVDNHNIGLRKYCILFDDLHLDIKKPVDKIGKYFTIEQETNKDVKEKMIKLGCSIILY
jgi:hypothetical protein